MIYKLKKPITYEGKEYKELEFDFDSLTGTDMLKARSNMELSGIEDMITSVSMSFQKEVASLAAKVPPKLIESLGARDFIIITTQTQNFLSGLDLPKQI